MYKRLASLAPAAATAILAVLILQSGCAPHGTPPADSRAVTEASSASSAKPIELPVDPNTGKPDCDAVRQRIEEAIQNVRSRDLTTHYGFWTVFHGILGLGIHDTYLTAPETGKKHNAVEWICKGNPINGMSFIPIGNDELEVQTVNSPDNQFLAQGHFDQFIAEMTQWGMPRDREFIVQGKKYTFQSFINHAMRRASVKKDQELSWTMLVIGQYEGTKAKDGLHAEWTNQEGEKLTLEDLIRYELNSPMNETAPCGGTHRLFDLSWLYQLHLKRGGKTEGIWKDVAEFIAKYQTRAKELWNPGEGAFSTNFLRDAAYDRDTQKRINTSGHIFEWLSLSLPDDRLQEGWVQEAALGLARMITGLGSGAMEGATLYHAVHGLIIYHGRVYEPEKFAHDFSWIPLPPKKR